MSLFNRKTKKKKRLRVLVMPAARQARQQKSSWKKSVAEKQWTEFAVLRF